MTAQLGRSKRSRSLQTAAIVLPFSAQVILGRDAQDLHLNRSQLYMLRRFPTNHLHQLCRLLPIDTYDLMLNYLNNFVRPTLAKLKVDVHKKENAAINGALLSGQLTQLGCYGSNASLRDIDSAQFGPRHGALRKIARTQKRAAGSIKPMICETKP